LFKGLSMKILYLSLIRFIGKIEDILCYSGLMICSFLVFFQVLNRYLLHYEIMWIGDLALYIYVPLLFLTIAMTAREKGHTTVDVFVDMFFKDRPNALLVYQIGINIIVLSILLYLLPLGHTLFVSALKYPEYGTLVTWFNTSWHRETLYIVLLLCLIHTLHHLGVQILDLYTKFNTTDPEINLGSDK
jgi:C4-dicarboxylate transporter DctQ subunit